MVGRGGSVTLFEGICEGGKTGTDERNGVIIEWLLISIWGERVWVQKIGVWLKMGDLLIVLNGPLGWG